MVHHTHGAADLVATGRTCGAKFRATELSNTEGDVQPQPTQLIKAASGQWAAVVTNVIKHMTVCCNCHRQHDAAAARVHVERAHMWRDASSHVQMPRASHRPLPVLVPSGGILLH